MEINDIISSGLLELYAAGIATEAESLQVEQWVAQYPEVETELNNIMSATEAYVNAYAITPDAGLKDKIFSKIIATENSKVVPLGVLPDTKAKVVKADNLWKVLAAASVILLVASIALNIVNYNKYTQANRNLTVAQRSLGDLEEKNKTMQDGLNVVQNKYSVPVSLKGQPVSPDAEAKVFWIQNTGEVFIDASNLPDAPAGKQYQFWGIVNGTPVDGGMITISSSGDKYRIQKMKSFGKIQIQAFAISLEAETGHQSPKGPIFVMGKM